MMKKNKKRQSKTGLPPGSHIYTGKKTESKTVIETYSYNLEKYYHTVKDAPNVENQASNLKYWINVTGLVDVESVKHICDQYGIHHLYQEDILNVFQRPKVEEEDEYVFVSFKALYWNDAEKSIDEEQISLILTQQAVITFQENAGDSYDYLRERIRTENSMIREKEVDYLFYRILDITVDTYFDIMEKMGTYLEEIEDEVITAPKSEILMKLQNNKKDIMVLRRHFYPMRDLINKLSASDHPMIDAKTKKYLRDVLDHTIQNIENVETFREMNMSLKDIYLNSMSHEMNRIMKILTIMSTFFIPLTFLVGVYGMNFKYMPELYWPYGYYGLWAIMIAIVLGLTYWFRKKGWF
jgi:magnesium transporter